VDWCPLSLEQVRSLYDELPILPAEDVRGQAGLRQAVADNVEVAAGAVGEVEALRSHSHLNPAAAPIYSNRSPGILRDM
jgi:hypothetical protein